MAYPLRHQPLKGLYFLYTAFSTLFVRVPYWTVTNLLPACRPNPRWSLSRVLLVKLLGVVGETLRRTVSWRIVASDPRKLEKDARKGVVWVDPVPELVHGEIAEMATINGVASVRVAGYWYGKRGADGQVGQKPEPGEKVAYELHGEA